MCSILDSNSTLIDRLNPNAYWLTLYTTEKRRFSKTDRLVPSGFHMQINEESLGSIDKPQT